MSLASASAWTLDKDKDGPGRTRTSWRREQARPQQAAAAAAAPGASASASWPGVAMVKRILRYAISVQFAAQHSTAQQSTIEHSTAQHSTCPTCPTCPTYCLYRRCCTVPTYLYTIHHNPNSPSTPSQSSCVHPSPSNNQSPPPSPPHNLLTSPRPLVTHACHDSLTQSLPALLPRRFQRSLSGFHRPP